VKQFLQQVYRMKNAIIAAALPFVALTCVMSPLSTVTLAEWQYRELKRPLDPKVEKLATDFNRGQTKEIAEGVKAIEETCFAYIAKLTASYEQSTPNFQAVRRQLDNLLAEGIPRQPAEARQALVSSIVRSAGSVAASDEYSPAARINCVSILGDLDEARDTRQNLRKPSAVARERLIQIQALPTAPGYLKAVALQGLERHARDGASVWDDNSKAKVKEAALGYIAGPFDEGLDQEIDVWLARRSLDLLRTLRLADAVDRAIELLGDPKQSSSLRLSSLQYITTQDLAALTPEQRKQYLLSTAHFLQSQLMDWYYQENDLQKRKSGAANIGGSGMGGMGMGGMGMGMGGMGMGSGDDGGSFGDGGMGMGGLGGRGAGGSGRGGRAVETQTWETRRARRILNQSTQFVRLAVAGARTSGESARVPSYLATESLGMVKDYNLTRLVQLIDALQATTNDIDQISTVPALMNRTKKDIIAILRFVKDMPGFKEKYADSGDGEAQLQNLQDTDAPGGNDAAGGAPAGDPTGGDSGADSGG
jgi:hypothetical protein